MPGMLVTAIVRVTVELEERDVDLAGRAMDQVREGCRLMERALEGCVCEVVCQQHEDV